VGENKAFERQYLAGELELEFTTQGTLAEKLRTGGAGIPAFFTRTRRRHRCGRLERAARVRRQGLCLERVAAARLSLAKAWKADRAGNLVFRRTARNLNPAVAMAGKTTVVEVEQIVETGSLDPDEIHLPGIYVHRLVLNANPEKRIERRTVRQSEEN
jgi:3-oxoacid CoA-transferase subunit A